MTSTNTGTLIQDGDSIFTFHTLTKVLRENLPSRRPKTGEEETEKD